ncbi:MAG: amidohydrolase family protein [Chloroflexota bacterium]
MTNSKTSIDTLIINAHLFTMQEDGVGYVENGAIAVAGQQIVAVGSSDDLLSRFTASRTLDAINCAVLPGLIDCHMHTTLSLVRGVAQDAKNWMQRALAPYSRHITAEGGAAATRLNALEALKAGTTTHGDYGVPYPAWGEIYEQLGVRAALTPNFNALPKSEMAKWAVGDLYPFDEAAGQKAMDQAVAFARTWNGAAEGRITTLLGVHGPDMMPREMLIKAKEIGQREGLKLHVHTAQGDREIEQILKRYGKRSIAFMEEIGYLDEQLVAVHLTEATDEETEQVAKSGASMIVCSGSIGIIDGIVPPARVFRQAGGIVGLGSDQASGNNCNNIFNEMKLTALFNKIKYRDPTAMPAWEVLRMATIDGAKTLGLDDRVGSLEVGKQADLILVDLTAPNLSPVLLHPIRNIVPNLVYAGSGHEVKTVMVAGTILVEDGQVLTVDETAIREDMQVQADLLAQRVANDPLHKDMVLMAAMAAGQL